MADETTTVDKSTEASSESSNEQIDQLKEQIGSLTSELESTRATIQAQREQAQNDPTSQDAIVNALKEAGLVDESGGETQQGYDYDAMSQSQALKVVEDKIAAHKQSTDETIQNAVAQIELKMQRDQARQELKALREKHPDLDEGLNNKEYLDNYIKIATENEKWGCDKVYAQIKMEERQKAFEQQQQDDEKAKREILANTEKGGIPITAAKAKDLTRDEAGELAMQQCFGNQEIIGGGG